MSHISYNDETWHSYTLPEEYQKNIHNSRDTPFEFCWHQYFSPEVTLKTLKAVLINMVMILIISAKLANLGLFKIKVFWHNGYDAIISD